MDFTRRQPADFVSAVQRTVTGETTPDGMETTTVIAEREYPYPIDDLWDALTNPERLPRWFAPVDGDFRTGGRYAIDGNASGIITTCEAPRHLALTWEFADTVSWADVTLQPTGDGTVLHLEHRAAVGDHWRTYGAGATGVGWDLAMLGLSEHLRTGESMNPDDIDPEKTDTAMVDFMRRSADAWGEAECASGVTRAEAEARRDATAAFYTGT